METRLVINLKEGQLEVSGNENFVKQIYDDFKDQISTSVEEKSSSPKSVNKVSKSKTSYKKSNAAHKTKGKPEINNELEINGLEVYFDQFTPKTDAEKTLIFVKYILEEKGLSECTLNDIHTCFFALKEKTKIPTNYSSMVINDQNRTKYFIIEDNNISISTIGENHFNQKLDRKSQIDL